MSSIYPNSDIHLIPADPRVSVSKILISVPQQVILLKEDEQELYWELSFLGLHPTNQFSYWQFHQNWFFSQKSWAGALEYGCIALAPEHEHGTTVVFSY